jgi:hypothetical protein
MNQQQLNTLRARYQQNLIIDRMGLEMGGQRYVLRVRPAPINPNLPIMTQYYSRIAALSDISTNVLQNLERADSWVLSVVMETMQESRLIHPNWGLRRRFFTAEEIALYLPEAIDQSVENMQQSDTDVELDDIVFELRFDRLTTIIARGKIPKWMKSTIANEEHTKGLAKYTSSENLCGLQAIVYALGLFPQLMDYWTGDLTWFTETYRSTEQLRRYKKPFVKLAKALGKLLGMAEPYEWKLGNTNDCTANQFILRQPKLQLVIFNEVTRQLMDIKRGREFDINKAEECTIILSYTVGHLQLVKAPLAYMGKADIRTVDQHFCYVCLKYQPHQQHLCQDFLQCRSCLTKFQSEEHYNTHCQWEFAGAKCLKCCKLFYSERCLACHQCLAQHIDVCAQCDKRIYPYSGPHFCGTYKCKTCRMDVGAAHRCAIPILDKPEEISAQEAGSSYYAFDLECMLIEMPNDVYRHEVNLVVVRQCFSDNEWVFHTMDEFVQWMEKISSPITMFAHNLKGYDGRIVFEYLFDKHCPPQEMVWRGSKIMKMQYGKVSFQDTLLHLPASLEQLPAMFGLDESQFKKGFFPYKFNTPENQAYIGPIPSINYFDSEKMKVKKRVAFLQWHEQNKDVVYDFKKELLEYCQSDVRILAKSIEAYMREQMAAHSLNPFESLTIASYACACTALYTCPRIV